MLSEHFYTVQPNAPPSSRHQNREGLVKSLNKKKKDKFKKQKAFLR